MKQNNIINLKEKKPKVIDTDKKKIEIEKDIEKKKESDKIDKSGLDSFPASDPPSWSGTSISKEDHSEKKDTD